MSYYARILFVTLLIVFSACSSKTDEQAGKTQNSAMSGSAALAATKRQRQDSALEKKIECARGQAEPIVRKKYFPSTHFILQPDSITAIETVIFKDGDKLIITNWGCDSYVLTFRFETSRFKADNSNVNYWYAATNKLMQEALPGIDAPLDIKAGVQALNSYAVKNTKHLKLRTELSFGGDETSRVVTLDTVAKMPKNRHAVVLSFTAGLL